MRSRNQKCITTRTKADNQAAQHADNALVGNKTGEDDMGHCLTRCAMVKAIEKDKQISQID